MGIGSLRARCRGELLTHRTWVARSLMAQGAIVALAVCGRPLLRSDGRALLLGAAAGFLPLWLWAGLRRHSPSTRELLLSSYLVAMVAAAGFAYRDPRQAQLTFACEMLVPVLGVVFLSRRAVTSLSVAAGCAAAAGTVSLGASPAELALRSSTVLIVVVLPGTVVAAFRERLVDAHRVAEEARARAETLSLEDPLTGVSNRRGMARAYPLLHREASRRGLLIGTLILDVDHFKRVNDEFGHDAGDRVLADVTAALRGQLRARDLVVRLGGEEFAVVTVVAGPGQLMELAERLRAAVAMGTSPHPVTVSVGASCIEPGAESAAAGPEAMAERYVHGVDSPLSALLRQADRQLYLAKAHGRDRAVGPAYALPPLAGALH